MDTYPFYAMCFRQKLIKRWGLMRCVNGENLSEHSMETAVIAHALAVIGNRIFGKNYDEGRIAVLALYHDAAEVYTGDLPTPVKYFSDEMRSSYARIESNAADKLLGMLPEELRGAYLPLLVPDKQSPEAKAELALVKAADKLCALIKCLDELKAGNGEFKNAAESIRASVDSLGCEELEYFTSRFLEPFSQTLDEINSL